jgi:hypothetical protein
LTAHLGSAIGGIILVTSPAVVKAQETIRPFKIDILESEITDLQQRIKATRWPEKETVNDRTQGVQLLARQVKEIRSNSVSR